MRILPFLGTQSYPVKGHTETPWLDPEFGSMPDRGSSIPTRAQSLVFDLKGRVSNTRIQKKSERRVYLQF